MGQFVQLRVSITVSQKEALAEIASCEMTSVSHVVRQVLQKWLEEQQLGKEGGSPGHSFVDRSHDRRTSPEL